MSHFSIGSIGFYFGSFIDIGENTTLQHQHMWGFENGIFVNTGYGGDDGIFTEEIEDDDMLGQYDFRLGMRGRVIYGKLSEKKAAVIQKGNWSVSDYDFIDNNCQLYVDIFYDR